MHQSPKLLIIANALFAVALLIDSCTEAVSRNVFVLFVCFGTVPFLTDDYLIIQEA